MTKIQQLIELGQAVWLDYIRRSFATSGGLQKLIDQGVRGVTSNPTIFDKAIAGSTDYDQDLQRMALEGRTAQEILQELMVADIQMVADLLRPVYEETAGGDGYVSLEVSPELADDTEGTMAEARRLFSAANRPNVFIKVPATPAGIPAIRQLISEGININITLMFSLAHYEAVANAYLEGLEVRAAAGEDISRVASVASFFVSRVDTAADKQLEAKGEAGKPLLGKIAIANSKLTYARFREIFQGERWERLAAKGAHVQRPLWASTSTKNPNYPDTLYVDSLIGPMTINTMPQSTFDAFQDHGTPALSLEANLGEARSQIVELGALGIDLDAITEQVQVEGVEAFVKSFESLLKSIEEKRVQFVASRPGPDQIGAQPGRWEDLGAIRPAVEKALADMEANRVMERIWSGDYRVWKPEPAEISNRLGWLHEAEKMCQHLPRLSALNEAVRNAGYTHALLLGMGGSSLAPEVFGELFRPTDGDLTLEVLDSTVPAAVLADADRIDPARTLFIVSSKSGTTVETLSFFKYFYDRTAQAVGADRAGEHFVAITDPGTKLTGTADKYHFRETFLADPDLGGRYSALSYFGLVPAKLAGVDVQRLLDRVSTVQAGCAPYVPAQDNLAAWLGAAMAEAAKAGRDKVTFVTSPALAPFGDWAEQLLAESTGKEGKGLVPVVGEPLGPPEVYGQDRLFVYLKLDGDGDGALQALKQAGHPVVTLQWKDLYDLGGQFFLWELATAVAGHLMGINPFDQPNVEAAKEQTRRLVDEYKKTGKLPQAESAPLTGEALCGFLAKGHPGDYIAMQAYLQPAGEISQALEALRTRLRDKTHLATTMGYGPRYLHSTGQLQKGDAGHELVIQLTADNPKDVPIPDEAPLGPSPSLRPRGSSGPEGRGQGGSDQSSISFGTLNLAQALGDRQALLDRGRRVIRFHLGNDVLGGLKRLTEALTC